LGATSKWGSGYESTIYCVKGYYKNNNYVEPYNIYENNSSTNSGAKIEQVFMMDEWDGEQW